MVEPARQLFTFLDYLELEDLAETKHEFLGGHVWAMAGGTPGRAAIAAAIIFLLSSQLQGKPCRVYSSDLRVRVLATGLSTYPDVTVICGRFEADPADPKGNTATNPRVIVEVLSASTEEYDRGEKLEHYQKIDGLSEVVLVGHSVRRIEIWSRREDGSWVEALFTGAASARIESLGCDLPLHDVYRDPLLAASS